MKGFLKSNTIPLLLSIVLICTGIVLDMLQTSSSVNTSIAVNQVSDNPVIYSVSSAVARHNTDWSFWFVIIGGFILTATIITNVFKYIKEESSKNE